MKVLKFGGSSVGTPDRIKTVSEIIDSLKENCVVVVSAFQGVTDQLLQMSELASRGDEDFKTILLNIIERHHDTTKALINNTKDQNDTIHLVDEIIRELETVITRVSSKKSVSKQDTDLILSTGERLSSVIISRYIRNSKHIDARKIIKTDSDKDDKSVDFKVTNELIKNAIGNSKKVIVTGGFIASNNSGETTTLGRGGSDYTAAIIAAAINAESLEIWTDVDGFMSADPKKVEKAYTIESLTYAEAMELSHFGAKVIYTPTLRPVYIAGIPVLVKNTLNRKSKGTLIGNDLSKEGISPIKGISSIDHIDLITLQGPAMVGITGTSARLFGALAKHDINIILITQASSEYSITFAVTPGSSIAAFGAIYEEFKQEIAQNSELKITVEKNLSIIAIVGEKMKNTPGISATLFRSLGTNGINVIATAQGSSELNISVVIKNESLKKALNVIHDGFFLSTYKEMNLFVAGTGLVGSSLLKQLSKQHDMLFSDHSLKINLLGITNSRKMVVEKKGIPLNQTREVIKDEGEKADIVHFIQMINKLNLRNSVFIDCTADARVASNYKDLLTSYVSVVTANKIACSSEYSYYNELKSIANSRGIRFMYETTVGAGLPVIKTINDLVLSGDKILKIEAVLSGTLNFIFNEISAEMPLSVAIKKAREKGYSEPDPRIDLSGLDVVRKILILSREAGYKLEKEDVEIVKFLPEDCFEGDLNEFYKKVELLDADFEKRRAALMKENKKWRFFATLDQGKAKVELLAVDSEHPSYNLAGSNNIILLTTERYRELPMVIKGYGAGADVTAAGVFADLMRVMNV